MRRSKYKNVCRQCLSIEATKVFSKQAREGIPDRLEHSEVIEMVGSQYDQGLKRCPCYKNIYLFYESLREVLDSSPFIFDESYRAVVHTSDIHEYYSIQVQENPFLEKVENNNDDLPADFEVNFLISDILKDPAGVRQLAVNFLNEVYEILSKIIVEAGEKDEKTA